MRIVLTVFAPLLVATGIRLALLLLGLVCGAVCELILTIVPSIDHVSDFESSFYFIGGFDTFDFNASWFYWVLVIIGSFIAEYIIWEEAEEEQRRKEKQRRKEEAIQQEVIYNKLDISIIATTTGTDIILEIACITDVVIDWGDNTETEILRTNKMQRVEKKYNSNGNHIIIIKGKVTELGCYGSDLTSLDVSRNIVLTYLRCSNNQLTSLDVSKNIALDSLSCYNNCLTSLDVSKNTALTYLDCRGNRLTSLNISACTVLAKLYCNDNQFTAEEMNKIYEYLPNIGYKACGDSKGELVCDKLGDWSIAKQKGWRARLKY